MRLLLVVALATIANAELPPMFGGRTREGFVGHFYYEVPTTVLDSAVVGVATIAQKLDHFDAKSTKTWQQRYFFNFGTASNESNVNMLWVSGEWPATINTVLGGAHFAYATKLGASIYSLEHRYYGGSHPTDDTSLENLKYLSSRQGVEDIAEFIRQMNDGRDDQKWILVGGSYAGNVAAWARLKHPELIAGVLASSAPLLAQLDFYGYLQMADELFAKQGGLCYDQISNGLEEAQKLMQSPEGREKLTEIFKITPPLSDYDVLSTSDIELFYGNLLSPFMGSAQWNQPAPQALCDVFTSNGAAYDPLQAFSALVEPEMDVNSTAVIESLKDVNYDQPGTSTRLWFYQTCAEFGYFQTTDRGTNVFGQVFTTRSYIEYCIKLFGMDADQIQRNIESINEYSGERDYFAGTNVVFTHGTQDPWSYLAKKSDPKHWSVVITEIEGAPHMADLFIACINGGAQCTENMIQVQQLTLKNMQQWIDPLFPVPDRVEITDNVGQRPQLYDPVVKPPLPVNVNAPEANIQQKRSVTRSKSIFKSNWNKFTGKRRELPVESEMTQFADNENIGNDWITQTYDHFNPNEERTFQQQWFYNLEFGSIDGPNFLLIGGEGLEDITWLANENFAWMTYAKAVGANAFILEHRYYGKSKLGTNDLQYLTSAQNIYDVATFIRTQQVVHGRTGPWITFGGSYPGMLAAWSREWFPELILGAVASSAPVQATVDYYGYLKVVEDVLQRQSQKCRDRTAEAFEQLRVMSMSPEGRRNISDIFSLNPEWTGDEVDPLDINTFFMEMYSFFQDTVQYNSVNWKDVQNLCYPFESNAYPDPIDALKNAQVRRTDYDETWSSFEEEIKPYLDMRNFIDGKIDGGFTDRDLKEVLYMWQTCNELGFYQTTDYGEGIFGTPVPINYFVTMCERIYGVSMDHIATGVARTLYQYGGRKRFNGTNVVFSNGDADPWHPLSILDRGNLDESVVPIVIKGTAHCTDMQAANIHDPPELTEARQTILATIEKWLAPIPTTEQPTFETTTASVPTTTTQTTTVTTPPSTQSSTSAIPTTSSIGGITVFNAAIIVAFLHIF